MATSESNRPPANLATLLLIKRKMTAKNAGGSSPKPQAPAPIIGAHSDEKRTYHQNTPETAAINTPENTTEQVKVTRKTKQMQVALLDKKMEEINRKHEEKTSEALDSWKGFDSMNYDFSSVPETKGSAPVPPAATKSVSHFFNWSNNNSNFHIFIIFLPSAHPYISAEKRAISR